jgi:hypothetical protein
MRGSARIRAAIRALRGYDATGSAPPSEPGDAGCSIDQAIETLATASTREVQDRGYHFQPRDYYSALNDLPFLDENRDLWHDRPLPLGIEWNVDAQLEEVRQIAPYLAELGNVPMDPPPGASSYHWDNDFWRGADALVHYGLLRSVKPHRVIEIGAGWSSLLMATALKQNEEEGSKPTEVTQIEPYPRRELLNALPDHWTLHDVILQRADPALFETLEAGDVCFYDGSHVARAGSDVVCSSGNEKPWTSCTKASPRPSTAALASGSGRPPRNSPGQQHGSLLDSRFGIGRRFAARKEANLAPTDCPLRRIDDKTRDPTGGSPSLKALKRASPPGPGEIRP